jgi:hypothetical protein
MSKTELTHSEIHASADRLSTLSPEKLRELTLLLERLENEVSPEQGKRDNYEES